MESPLFHLYDELAITHSITNIAAAQGTNTEPASGAATITIPTISDLMVTQDSDKSQVCLGKNVIYTITVSNKGPDEAMSVVLEDMFIPGTSMPTINSINISGSPATYSLTDNKITFNFLSLASATITIDATLKVLGILRNIATVYSTSSFDPDHSNNETRLSIEVFNCPNRGVNWFKQVKRSR